MTAEELRARSSAYYVRYCAATDAARVLRNLRDDLRDAGARHTADKVRSAIKSAKGAANNAWLHFERDRQELAALKGRDLSMSAPHSAYWAACPDCDTRVAELLAEGLPNGDAQGVAEAEHMRARACPECGRQRTAHAASCSRRPGQRDLGLS